MNPTAEQLEALRLFASGKSLAIEAGAGTGKTSTLRLLAESTPRRGQYIAFNKSIVTEAGSKMPSTVRCNTAHSLAMREIGRQYAHRLDSGRMRSDDIARRLRLDPIHLRTQDGEGKSLSAGYLAGLVMRSVVSFCQSADPEPTRRHVPYIEGIDIPPGAYDNNRLVAKAIEPAMRRAWEDLMDLHGSLPYRHDHYLKAWQLSGPRISADYILFDEAQDANPVMVAIVAAQTHAQLVWVGDSQQQIYTFTGAVNALEKVPAHGRTFLTQSFRFGPAIATVANGILAAARAELRLKGTESIPSRVGKAANPNVVLTRTNAAAVRRVLSARKAGISVHLVGGGTEVVSFAKAAQMLMDGRRTDHHELACFETWNEVLDYVDQDEQGGELRLLVALITEFGVDTILEALDRMPREAEADLVVSTAHKSKGREWDAVELGDDFPEEPKGEELRLLYVACTRAKLLLDISAVPALTNGTLELLAGSEVPVPAAVDHDAADHDFANCPDCIREAREAELLAEAPNGHSVQEHLNGVPGEFLILRSARSGNLDPIRITDSRRAIEHASECWRTGRFLRVTVIDGAGELVVEYDA